MELIVCTYFEEYIIIRWYKQYMVITFFPCYLCYFCSTKTEYDLESISSGIVRSLICIKPGNKTIRDVFPFELKPVMSLD